MAPLSKTILAACLWLTASLLASASPTHIAERDDYAPAPIRPDANTVWTIGEWASVSWDASSVLSTATNIPWIDLYKTSSFGSAEEVLNLAANVDPHAGRVDFRTPDVEPGSYFVMVGAWGQSSAHFTIQAPPYVPKIITPNGDSVWTVGGVGTVTWDTSNLPAHPGQISAVWLYTTSEYGSAVHVATLATKIDPSSGTVSFPVPADLEPKEYFVMVGLWGNSSQRFSIVAAKD